MDDLAPLVAELRDYERVVATALTRRDVAPIGGTCAFYLAGARHTGNAPLASTGQASSTGRAAALPAGAPVDGQGGIHGYTSGIIEALDGRDFERAAELTRGYVRDVLPGILQAYRRASERMPGTAPRLRRA